MKKLKTLSIYISSYRIWVLTLLGIDLFFAFLIWAVCPNNFVSYIENWVHEIKKPVSLMTLLLDNRKNEMSNMVHQRMLYVRDQTRQDIEQILYFSRLGATHKDYYFEKISLKSICQESIEDNRTLLEEAGFSINYSGNENVVVSDKKGLMFILGQVISNSVKYSTKKEIPILSFSIMESQNEENILLSISDNGSNIPESDIPFVFDKGFTGNTGSYLSRSTGMGLYLVRKMANDLSIDVEIKNNSYGGVTIILFFPKVKNSLITQGCLVNGNVEGSVLFNNVNVGEGAKVIDSVLMPGVLVEEGAEVYKAIVDEGVVIRAKTKINKEAKEVALVSDNK